MKAFRADTVTDTVLDALVDSIVDITGAASVGVQLANGPGGKILWVTVNGITVLRICRIQEIECYGI